MLKVQVNDHPAVSAGGCCSRHSQYIKQCPLHYRGVFLQRRGGKSTLAAHLAQELAHRRFKVGLVDVDIHGPSVPTIFNLSKAEIYVNKDKQFIPIEKNNLKIMSFWILLGDAPAVMRGPIVSRYVQQILHQTAWGELDYLFIDMPPGTGDVQLTITQTARLNGAVIVTTRQTLSLVDVSREF